SGSMEGQPMNASKVFMRHAMRNLRPDDYFRIIHFGDNASELTNGPVSANRKNILQGLSYINKLTTYGGTEIVPAIRKAFSTPRINQALWVATPEGQWPVWHCCAWMQPIESMDSRAIFMRSQPMANATTALSGKPNFELPIQVISFMRS
ncbi:MAG: hypothetical protein COC11_01010, partial [Candidatus Neomarinimicrobiota bacterium]